MQWARVVGVQHKERQAGWKDKSHPSSFLSSMWGLVLPHDAWQPHPFLGVSLCVYTHPCYINKNLDQHTVIQNGLTGSQLARKWNGGGNKYGGDDKNQPSCWRTIERTSEFIQRLTMDNWALCWLGKSLLLKGSLIICQIDKLPKFPMSSEIHIFHWY